MLAVLLKFVENFFDAITRRFFVAARIPRPAAGLI